MERMVIQLNRTINIRRQLLLLYLYEGLVSFRITDAVWVLFLLGRGFSLVEVGLAEAIFHVTSMLFEVPSGMAADLFGRKRSLLLSGVMSICSSLCMGYGGAGMIYPGMVFAALSYNLISGTEEALFYDSLTAVGMTDSYKLKMSWASIIGRACAAAACLFTPIAILLGYRKTYTLAALLSLTLVLLTMMLQEPVVTNRQRRRTDNPFREIPGRTREHIRSVAAFVKSHPRTMCKLLADAAIACPCFLTMMYLQEHLTACGWPKAWIGLPLLLIPLAGAGGVWLAAHLRVRFFPSIIACGLLGGLGTCLAGFSPLPVIIAGAMLGQVCAGFSELAASESINRDFSSDERATLISLDSMMYSVLMIAASLLTGWLGERFSMTVMFAVLGGLLAAMSILLGGLYRRRTSRRSPNNAA